MKITYEEATPTGGHDVEGTPHLNGLRLDGLKMLVDYLARALAVGRSEEERARALGFDPEVRLYCDADDGYILTAGERALTETGLHEVASVLGAPAYPKGGGEEYAVGTDDPDLVEEYAHGGTVKSAEVHDERDFVCEFPGIGDGGPALDSPDKITEAWRRAFDAALFYERAGVGAAGVLEATEFANRELEDTVDGWTRPKSLNELVSDAIMEDVGNE